MEAETKENSTKPALPVVAIEPATEKVSIPERLFAKLRKEQKKLTVRTWVNVSGQEVAIEEKRVALGALDVDIGGNNYSVDYNSIQNIFGELVYNTTYRVANGALRFISQSTHDVDAKIRKQMKARDNLHSIWSRWQLPFIACIIAIMCAIVAISILAVIIGQLQTANNCLNNESCMASKILQLRAEAEVRAQTGANQ